MRMMWFTVSNAADKSSKPSIVTCPRSTAVSKKKIISRTAVSVEWPRRYVDCRSGISPFSSMYETSWRQTSLSIIFYMNVRFEIERYITLVSTSILEVWCDDDVALTERQTALVLHISTMNGRTSGRNSFRICVGSGFSEQDLVGIAEIIFSISSADSGSKLSKTAGVDSRLDSAGIPSVAYRTDSTLLLKKLRRSSAVGWFGRLFLPVLEPSRVAIERHSFFHCLDCSLTANGYLNKVIYIAFAAIPLQQFSLRFLDLFQQAIHAVNFV